MAKSTDAPVAPATTPLPSDDPEAAQGAVTASEGTHVETFGETPPDPEEPPSTEETPAETDAAALPEEPPVTAAAVLTVEDVPAPTGPQYYRVLHSRIGTSEQELVRDAIFLASAVGGDALIPRLIEIGAIERADGPPAPPPVNPLVPGDSTPAFGVSPDVALAPNGSLAPDVIPA